MLVLKKLVGLFLIFLFIFNIQAFSADDSKNPITPLKKPLGREDRKEGIHDGNMILTVFYNYGCIGQWWIDTERLTSGIFPKGSGHSYFAEFTPMVGAEVHDVNDFKRTIFSDGAGYTGRADMAPGNEYQYGFEPIRGYADESQDYIAMYNAQGSEDNDGNDQISAHLGSEDDDGKPDSWPWVWPDRPEWVNPYSGIPYWNGQYGAYNRATQESYFRMNDYANDEWNFYPDLSDSSKRGLGLNVEVRGYQWADPAAEDIIIFTYWITNMGKKTYEKTVFGMYGDADIGERQDNKDDLSEFNKEQDIVYQWDKDLWSVADGGFKPGYFGWKFLESPGDPLNGVDDDDDGMIDESQEDGIDNDGDWDPTIDDVGKDGKGSDHPDYPGPDPDGTEGNGVPDRGEPNFEYTDNDESDQIGLTSFMSADWNVSTAIDLSNDALLWQQTIPGTFSKPANEVDIIMHYGSGYFKLPPDPDPDSRRKFAISMVMGVDRDDLVRNALTMQQIYDHDYNFAATPYKPLVSAVSGDQQVLLYWNKTSERSRDPIYGHDFEGYVIYRATDPGFLESYVGTDAYGNAAFNKPIAQFDYDNGLKGPHPVARDGIQFNMGNDTGLQYTFIDSGQTWAGPIENGQTYYYAVCSYDKGYYYDFFERGLTELDSLQPKAPAVCEKTIRTDASGVVNFLDINTVMVTPNAPASGYIEPPELTSDNGWVKRTSGVGTGKILVQPIDPIKVIDGANYEISFDDSSRFDSTKMDVDTTFSVKNLTIYTETIKSDTNATLLKHQNIDSASFVVKLSGEDVTYQKDVDYEVGFTRGNFKATKTGAMPISNDETTYYVEISYQYYPVYTSNFLSLEDRNEYFDGLRILINNEPLEASEERSIWLTGDEQQYYLAQYGFIGKNDPIPAEYISQTNYRVEVSRYTNQGVKVPYDFHIVIYDTIVTKSKNNKWANVRVFNTTTGDTADFVFLDSDADSMLTSGDLITPITYVNNRMKGTWQAKFWAPSDFVFTVDSLDTNGRLVFNKEGEVIKIPVDTMIVPKIPPKPGDIFYIAANKPFSSDDKFTFTAQAPEVNYTEANSNESLKKIAVVPNPYIVTASWEPQHFYSSGRGIRKVDFIHLPPKCTIKIFTIRGYLVNTIKHDSPINDGSESWNLLSKDGMEIAYGVYLFHVETPTGESIIGKFAVIK